jgi:hypothetical protein
VREPCITSAAAASSQSGEKPKAAIEPSSTALPAPLRIASLPGSGSYSAAGAERGRDRPHEPLGQGEREGEPASHR